MDDDLAQQWMRAARDVGAADDWAQATGQELRRRYREPHRAYHTLRHIAEVLAAIDALAASGEPIADLPAVRLAAWFHDVIYEPGSPDNERASAEFAAATLVPLGLAAGRVETITAVVIDTADHVPRSTDARVLVDADLAILGADPARYAEYAREVRAEYAAIPEPQWRVGRGAVLDGLLARSPLYTTATMRARLEDAARRNLLAERARISSDVPA